MIRHEPGFLRRHLLLLLLLACLTALTVGFVAWTDWKQKNDAKSQAAAQVVQFAALDKQVKATIQKKIDDAKKAEAEARANAEALVATEKAKAAAHPSGAVSSTKACDVTNPSKVTVVLNKKHCFNPIDWAPNDLVSVGGYYLRSEAAAHIQELIGAASAAGLPIDFSSAYRSYANQQVTYNNWVAVNGSQAAADSVSARPGFSEHQTGLAADLKVGSCVLECFGGTAQYTWLAEHAAEHGFIRRYPVGLSSITGYEPEVWHWRYVGLSTAQDMKAKGIETLEQYFGISGGDYAS